MPMRTITLSDDQERVIEDLLRSGRYQTANDVIRDGLKLIATRERSENAKLQALRQMAQLGIADLADAAGDRAAREDAEGLFQGLDGDAEARLRRAGF